MGRAVEGGGEKLVEVLARSSFGMCVGNGVWLVITGVRLSIVAVGGLLRTVVGGARSAGPSPSSLATSVSSPSPLGGGAPATVGVVTPRSAGLRMTCSVDGEKRGWK